MKSRSKSLIALAVAGSFACASAFAGGGHHGAQMSDMGTQMSTEVQTPASVSESAPWLTGHPHLAGWDTHAPAATIGFQEGQFSDGPVGMSSDLSSSGTVAFDSSTSIPADSPMGGSYDSTLGDSGMSDGGDTYSVVEYWLIGDEPAGTGTSSSLGASGSGGYDSSAASSGDGDSTAMSGSGSDDYAFDSTPSNPLSYVYTPSAEMIADTIGEATPLLSEHYLVYGPLASFQGNDAIVLEIGPAAEDVALLDSLSRDFYILTPSYDEG
jgi:hypothetical protein